MASQERPIVPGERAKALAAAEMFLRMLSLARDCFPDEDMDAVTIRLTVASASVGRLLRDRAVLEALGSEPVSEGMQTPVSARAIAASTGLPRETVRRKVRAMIADGRILEDERGIRMTPDLLGRDNNLRFARGLILELERAGARLGQFGPPT